MMNFMSTKITTLITLICMVTLLGTSTIPVNASENQNDTNSNITVEGKGTLKVKPDTAQITLGVKTVNKEAKVAEQENAKLMEDVINALKNAGINNDNIETSNFNIYPKYRYIKEQEKNVIEGYEVNNTITITTKKIDKVGSIIDIAVSKGINVSNGLRFYVEDNEKYYQDALKKAVINAKGKANAIAQASEINITKPSSIEEISNGGGNVYFDYRMNAMAKEADEMYTTPINVGDVEITASVRVTYQF